MRAGNRSFLCVGSMGGAFRIIGGPSAGLYYRHGDHLGSTSVISDANGLKIPGSEVQYAPFGELRSGELPALTDFGYTGQRVDRSTGGLMYYDARYYLPGLRRFVSADSIVADHINSQAFNRYSYTYNNPLRYTDPTGHLPEEGSDEWWVQRYYKLAELGWLDQNGNELAGAPYNIFENPEWNIIERLQSEYSIVVMADNQRATSPDNLGLWTEATLLQLSAALKDTSLFLQGMGGSFDIFAGLKFVAGDDDGTGKIQCRGVTDYLGCTASDGTSIRVSARGYTKTTYEDLFIHEMGHAFLNRIATQEGMDGPTLSAVELFEFKVETGIDLAANNNRYWGSSGSKWRVNSSSLSEEQFADMFLGMVTERLYYRQDHNTPTARYVFMTNFMDEYSNYWSD